MKEKKNTKYLIIGAGISGLSFANFLDSDDYIIVEKENEAGGFCRTIFKDDFIWDYAGHFFHFKTDEMKNLFINSVGKENIINKNKNTKILYNNKLIDYPFQTNIHQLNKEEFIECLVDLWNKKEKDEYDNFLDMLYGKFGKSIVEKFLKPYNEKLYACDLKMLDKDAMGRFFPYADLDKIINNMKSSEDKSYNNTFLYPKQGASCFINNLYRNLNENNVLLNTCIIDIDFKNKVAHLDNGNDIKFEFLINTSPLNTFIDLFNKQIDVLSLKKELSYNKVLVFNLGFDKKSNFDEHWIYIPDKEINFYRIGFYDNILDSNKLSMYIEIGFSKEADINIEEQLKLTLKNLRNIGVINDHKLEAYSTIIMDPAYVHISNVSNKLVSDFFNILNSNDIYSIGRYGAWTYCSMEDCMIEAKKLAASMNNSKK